MRYMYNVCMVAGILVIAALALSYGTIRAEWSSYNFGEKAVIVVVSFISLWVFGAPAIMSIFALMEHRPEDNYPTKGIPGKDFPAYLNMLERGDEADLQRMIDNDKR